MTFSKFCSMYERCEQCKLNYYSDGLEECETLFNVAMDHDGVIKLDITEEVEEC